MVGCLQEAPVPSRERTVSLLMSLLQDEQIETRRTAVEALGKIGDQTAVSSILPLLRDPSPLVRAAAAQAIGRMGPSSASGIVVALAQALEDPVDPVREAVAIAIGDVEPVSNELGTVIRLAVSADDAGIRYSAIQALLQIDPSGIEEQLIPVLRDPDDRVRQGATALLGSSSDPIITREILDRLLSDISSGVRAEAGYQVGKVGGPEVLATLEKAIGQEVEVGVRRWIEAELRLLRVND